MIDDRLPKVLIVDDEPGVLSFLSEALMPLTDKVACARDAQVALHEVETGDFDVIVCDLHMPKANGLELLTVAREAHWDVAFILITGRPELPQILDALRLDAFDLLVKPFRTQDLVDSLHRAYKRLLAERQGRLYKRLLENSIERRTRELEAALSMMEANYRATLEALVAALDAREHETYAHSFRVREYAIHLARLAGYPENHMRHLDNAALLHDIGKVAVADSVLLKPGKLTEDEWAEMRKHSAVGESILKRVSFLLPAAHIVRQHHERFDGTGYPDGLAGEQISLGARIFAFADTLDAMTSDRFYRKALGYAAARAEIVRCSGTQFDPRIAAVFLTVPDSTWIEVRSRVEGEYHAKDIENVACSQ